MENSKPRKTFILEWRPAISSYRMEDFEYDFNHLTEARFNWSIWDYSQLNKLDYFYLIKCGEGSTGIVMQGLFFSECYRGEDWSGKNREVYYADLLPIHIIHPDRCRLLSTEALEKAMPEFKWNGGHSGRVLQEEYAIKLRSMWHDYLAMNDNLICQISDDLPDNNKVAIRKPRPHIYKVRE